MSGGGTALTGSSMSGIPGKTSAAEPTQVYARSSSLNPTQNHNVNKVVTVASKLVAARGERL